MVKFKKHDQCNAGGEIIQNKTRSIRTKIINIFFVTSLIMGFLSGCLLNSDDDGCKCKQTDFTYNSQGQASKNTKDITCTSELKAEASSGSTTTIRDFDGFGRVRSEKTISCD